MAKTVCVIRHGHSSHGNAARCLFSGAGRTGLSQDLWHTHRARGPGALPTDRPTGEAPGGPAVLPISHSAPVCAFLLAHIQIFLGRSKPLGLLRPPLGLASCSEKVLDSQKTRRDASKLFLLLQDSLPFLRAATALSLNSPRNYMRSISDLGSVC